MEFYVKMFEHILLNMLITFSCINQAEVGTPPLTHKFWVDMVNWPCPDQGGWAPYNFLVAVP